MNSRFEIIDGKCVIPDTVTDIPFAAFFYCISLKEVRLPATLRVIGSQAFEGCTKLRSIDIPDGVAVLDKTFYRCANLREIRIPKSVTEIGPNSFSRCLRMGKIEVDIDNPTYKSELNCCLTKDGKALVFGCKTSSIPAGVTKIMEFAFYGCSGLRSVTIPEGVEYIGENAFCDCTRLLSVNIPASVKEIGNSAFAGSPIRDIYLSARDPEGCADLREGLKYNRLKDIILHVPEGAEYAYGRHPFFRRFRMIQSWNG